MRNFFEELNDKRIKELHDSLKSLELAHEELVQKLSLARLEIRENEQARLRIHDKLLFMYEQYPDKIFPSIPRGYCEIEKKFFIYDNIEDNETVFGIGFEHVCREAVKKFSDGNYIYEAGHIAICPMDMGSNFCSTRIYKKTPINAEK